MENLFLKNNEQILRDLGKQLRTVRIESKISQKDLSRYSGVSVHTISNIENGKDFSVDNLISILRSLSLLENLNLLVPEIAPNPYDLAKGLVNRTRVYRSLTIKNQAK